MNTTKHAVLQARIDVLSIAVQEVARALSRTQTTQVSMEVQRRAEALVADRPALSANLDETISVELASLLRALDGA